MKDLHCDVCGSDVDALNNLGRCTMLYRATREIPFTVRVTVSYEGGDPQQGEICPACVLDLARKAHGVLVETRYRQIEAAARREADKQKHSSERNERGNEVAHE